MLIFIAHWIEMGGWKIFGVEGNKRREFSKKKDKLQFPFVMICF